MPFKSFQENISHLQNRFVYVVAVVIIFFLSVTVRLYYLQIIRGDEYRSFANENTLKEIRIPAVRGPMLDRNLVPIVTSRPSFNLALIPQYVRDIAAVSTSLDELANVSPAHLNAVWPKTQRMAPFYPFVVSRDIGFEAMAKIQVRQAIEDSDLSGLDLQGVEIIPQPIRRYPKGSLAANTIGYVRETSKKELKRLQKAVPNSYHMGDQAGAFGLERYWEVFLKGEDGYQQKFVNAVGREVQSKRVWLKLLRKPALRGNTLVTTFDYRLQEFAKTQFKDKTGALVAMNPQTGRIYALVSTPSFNLASLAGQVPAQTWKELTEDPGKVFLNRTFQAAYPPGSTYKIVTAAASLEDGVTTPEEKIRCPGFLRFGRRAFKCWKRSGHGLVDLHKAIVQSCDVYFYTMGIRLGVDKLAKYANMFGLGFRTGIELPHESPGLIPTAAWKKRARGSVWHPGENLSIAIGQGYDLVTPLQNAIMVAAIANGGYKLHPTLSHYFLDRENQRFDPPSRLLVPTKERIPISDETFKILKAAMVGVVADPGGTAGRLRRLPFKSGGKTGTSQVVSEKSGLTGPKYRDHALYVAFAPVEDPEIAVSVIVEHGGHGSSAAAPVAGAVMEKFMELKAADEGPKEAVAKDPKKDA